LLERVPIYYHASAPFLEPLTHNQEQHQAAAHFLAQSDYRDNWVSLEMKRPESPEILDDSVQNLVTWYAQ
jgi:hypothetical protein